MDDGGWEQRMAERRRTRDYAAAARCLGIRYGDPGPLLEARWCRECWGDRHVWLGNAWGVRHAGGTMSGCGHGCHADEVWLATG